MRKPERERVSSTCEFHIVPLYKCCAQDGKTRTVVSKMASRLTMVWYENGRLEKINKQFL